MDEKMDDNWGKFLDLLEILNKELAIFFSIMKLNFENNRRQDGLSF